MLAAAYRCLSQYLQEANGHKFSKWTSRGSKDLYRAILLDQVVEVNPGALLAGKRTRGMARRQEDARREVDDEDRPDAAHSNARSAGGAAASQTTCAA